MKNDGPETMIPAPAPVKTGIIKAETGMIAGALIRRGVKNRVVSKGEAGRRNPERRVPVMKQEKEIHATDQESRVPAMKQEKEIHATDKESRVLVMKQEKEIHAMNRENRVFITKQESRIHRTKENGKTPRDENGW